MPMFVSGKSKSCFTLARQKRARKDIESLLAAPKPSDTLLAVVTSPLHSLTRTEGCFYGLFTTVVFVGVRDLHSLAETCACLRCVFTNTWRDLLRASEKRVYDPFNVLSVMLLPVV
jgi:hypothetical protein